MFSTGSLGGREDPRPLASRGEDSQKSPAEEDGSQRRLQRCLLGAEVPLQGPSAVETKPNANEGGSGVGEEEMAEDEGSSHVVEHILKELKGINKIQEEISDLRHYLSSVRGSVDEVSCCVDAVLSEIGELYSGASAAPLQAPVPHTANIRRGSLGRQNAVTSFPSPRSPAEWRVRRVDQQDKEEHQRDPGAAKADLCYMELHRRHDYQSTSSLSSVLSPEAAFSSEDHWASAGVKDSGSQDGGWSEEDVSSSLQAGPGLWDQVAAEEMESSTPPSSSSGHRYNSPSGASSVADWRHLRAQSQEKSPACQCSVCPYSRSSGYQTVDPCLNDLGSEPSRSLSSSTVQLTDRDDPSFGDTLDLGSTDTLDRDWTEYSVSRDEALESLESSVMDLHGTKSSSFDVTTFSKAVFTFRSALKGALKKLEGCNPEEGAEEQGSEADRGLAQQSLGGQTLNTLKEDLEALVLAETPENPQTFPLPVPHSPTQSHMVELPHETGVCSAPVEQSDHPERCAGTEAGTPPGPGLRPDEARLSPIRENQLPEEGQARPTDAGHRERIANFQRILREKRRARHRLSRSVQGSQGSQGSYGSRGSYGSHGSQGSHGSHGSYGSQGSHGSQGSQSQDEFVPGTVGVFSWDGVIGEGSSTERFLFFCSAF